MIWPSRIKDKTRRIFSRETFPTRAPFSIRCSPANGPEPKDNFGLSLVSEKSTLMYYVPQKGTLLLWHAMMAATLGDPRQKLQKAEMETVQ